MTVTEIPPELMKELVNFLQGIIISLLVAGGFWRMGDRLHGVMEKRGWI